MEADRETPGGPGEHDDALDLAGGARSVLAVVAHPDDESFGLGAVLDRLTTGGAACSVLCFTRGESSTLHQVPGELAAVRAEEFAAAAAVLGLYRAELRSYPDGGLSAVPVADLAYQVRRVADDIVPDHLLAFDIGGVTGHPDHNRATEAAISAAAVLGVPVLGWALPVTVAETLNAEFGAAFAGRSPAELDQTLTVDRARQWRAIGIHASQSTGNRVLRRRLELLGDREHVRLLPELNVRRKETTGRRVAPQANGHERHMCGGGD